jgi:hypothetical protein
VILVKLVKKLFNSEGSSQAWLSLNKKNLANIYVIVLCPKMSCRVTNLGKWVLEFFERF